jgi:hypothetical protein
VRKPIRKLRPAELTLLYTSAVPGVAQVLSQQDAQVETLKSYFDFLERGRAQARKLAELWFARLPPTEQYVASIVAVDFLNQGNFRGTLSAAAAASRTFCEFTRKLGPVLEARRKARVASIVSHFNRITTNESGDRPCWQDESL